MSTVIIASAVIGAVIVTSIVVIFVERSVFRRGVATVILGSACFVLGLFAGMTRGWP